MSQVRPLWAGAATTASAVRPKGGDKHPPTSWPSRSPQEAAAADAIDAAVRKVIASGLRTGDIWSEGTTKVGTAAMGDSIALAICL